MATDQELNELKAILEDREAMQDALDTMKEWIDKRGVFISDPEIFKDIKHKLDSLYKKEN